MSIMYQGGDVTKYDQGEYTFAIHQFPPFHAIKVLGEVQKVLGPALGGMSKGVKPDNLDMETSNVNFISSVVSETLNALAANVDGDKLENMMALVLDPDYIAVAPKHSKDFQRLDESALNEIFSGRIIDMLALAAQVLKVNYLDFSKLSTVPTGARTLLGDLKRSFRGAIPTSSDK